MAFTYGTSVPLLRKPEEEDAEGRQYGDPVPLVTADYSKATYGKPVPIADLDPVTPKRGRSLMVRRPGIDELEDISERYGSGSRMQAADRITSAGAGGGVLGLPSQGAVLEKRYPGVKEKMDAMEEAAWEGQEESGWGEVFGNTLRNVLPKFRRQIVGGMRGGDPVTIDDLQRNADLEIGQFGAGTGDISQSIQNRSIAKEWGFEEGSEKVPPGVDPVRAFADWLQSEEGTAEVQAEAAKTPVAMVAQDIWDVETGKINENAIQVKPRSAKYYAAGILDAGINMGPAMAATIVTRNPTVGASIMGGQVYGDTYGEMLDRGYTQDQAMAAALFSAAAETLTERIPLGILTKGDYAGLKRVFAGAAAEGIQEPVTEALQIGYDVGILNEDMTMGEAVWRLIDAGIIGFGVGAGMGAGVETLEQLSTPAAREANEYDQLIDTLHLSLNKKAEEARALEELEKNVEELDNVVNQQAKDLAPEQLDALEAQQLIKINEDGSVKVLPKGRRRLAKQTVEANRKRKEQALKARGVADDEAGPTVEILDTQPAFATAEVNTNVEPTDGQKARGNYEKGRFTWNGMDLAIENPAGSTRSGVNRKGERWQQTMSSGYGYFPSKPGADHVPGEPTEGVDAYFGPDMTIQQAYVINQANDPSQEAIGDNFDEHKVMIGYPSMEAAIEAYKADYAPARGHEIEAVPFQPQQFKAWLNQPVHDQPVSLGERDGYEKAPVFATLDETVPTVERYPMRGKNVIGAPPGKRALADVDTEINATLDVLEDAELIPTEAWTWYEDSGKTIRDVARGEPELMHDVVKILAVLSQASSVAVNTTSMINAAYKIARGETAPKVGRYPATMSKNIEQLLPLSTEEISDELPGIGTKLMSFYRNLYDATFNTNFYDDDVTIDRWMARILEYGGDTVSGLQYDYARKVFQDAIKRYNARNGTNWLPRHAQAAVWVHERSRSSMEKTGEVTPVDAFSEHLERSTMKVTHEMVPSKKTEDGAKIEQLPREQKAEYTRRLQENLADGNEHKIMQALGVPLYNETTGVGGYEGNINPNQVTNVVVGKESGKWDKGVADMAATILMYVNTQDSVPWFRAERKADTKKRMYSQGYYIDLESELSEEQEAEFFDALRAELGPDAGFSQTRPDQLVIIDFKNEKGVSVSGLSPAEFIEKMDQIADNIGADIGIVETRNFGAEGNNLTHDWEADPDGQALEETIQEYASESGRPDLLRLARDWRKNARRLTSQFIAAEEKPREGAAAPVPVDRLDDRPATEAAVFSRFGSLDPGVDTTESLKFYDLTTAVENPELTTNMAASFGYQIEVFSFEPGNFKLPRLGKKNYEEGTVWIYDPEAAHGSFKDTEYTRAWRVTHEVAHGITERYMQERYGDSKRYGRLGRTMMGERGVPPKRVEVELEPLTLMQAQRAVEWEDVAFRVQRKLLDSMGIAIPNATFAQEANVNMADAVFRTVTGDFADPGELGFRPSVIQPAIKSVLTGLERTEQALATEQGRDATEGIDLATFTPITDAQLDEAIELQSREPAVAATTVITTKAVGVPVENLKAIVEEAFQLYPNSPNVRIAPTEAELPARQMRDIKNAGLEGKVAGIFDTDTGTVYLIAANMSSMKEALEIYLHETVGHYGLRSILGAEYDSTMDRVAKSMPAKVKDSARRNGLDMEQPRQRRLAAEEHIAYTAQRVLAGETVPARDLSLLQRLVEALRIALARLRGVQMSEVELHRLIRKARLYVATPGAMVGGIGRGRTPPVMLSGLWRALNNDRVPTSGRYSDYNNELLAQRKAGNLTPDEYKELASWMDQQLETSVTRLPNGAVSIDKADLMEKVNEMGSRNPFHVEADPDAPRYPMAPRDEWYGEADYEARGGRLDQVTPDAFLALAAPLEVDETARENIDDLKEHIRAGRTLDPLTLYPGERVRDSDGRHRAIAAKELGINLVPVVNFRPEPPEVYVIIDRQTGQQVGKPYQGKNAKKRARTRVDKLDNEYGAYRYQSRRLKEDGTTALFHVEEYDGRREAIETGPLFENFGIEEGSRSSQAWNYLVFKAQDKFIDLLNVQKAIEMQTGRQLPDHIDTYLAEELFHGRVKSRIDRFEKDYIKPLIEEIQTSDYTWDEVEWYLYARHAPEANAALYKINKATPAMVKKYEQALEDAYDDATRTAAQTEFHAAIAKRLEKKPELKSLSGMSNEDAKHVMGTLEEKGDMRQMRKIAQRVDSMTARNREIMLDEGLETQETIDAWEATYDHYVPLKGFKDGPMNTTFFPKKGKGYDTGGKLNQRRLGRKSLAANIMANVVAQHQSAVIMAEKAKVGRTMLEMVQEHPNENLWTANEVETKKRLDPKTGMVVTAVDPTYKLKDNVLRVKVDGKDFHITFNENNAAAMRIAGALKNLSSQEINIMFRGMLGLNRILSAVNTSFNPEFIVSNLARDLQTAMINLNATDADNMKMAILRDVFKAHRGIRRFLDMPSFKNQESADYWRTQFEEYRDLGGQVGWLDNYKDVQDLEASLYRQMHDRTAGMISWSTLRKMGNYIEMENQAIENSVRLSAFVHAREAGLSGKRAASLAKNLTVNFNRKGDIGTAMNALYLFYNASIQGMAIMWKAAKSPKVRAVMYGIVGFAAALEIMNRMLAGDDDDGENRYDKIPAWVKERNMIVMLPEQYQPEDPESFDDYYITIPLPYGYNMLHVVGQKLGGIVDYTGIGNKREWKPMEDAAEILAAALGSFNPIGTGPTPLQTIIPTAMTPLVQVSENVAWHGGPVMPPQNPWDPSPEPESQQYFRSAPKHAVALAEFLNKLGGGSKARPAKVEFLDISPETIQLWEDFLTGGAGRFVSNMVELGVMAKEDKIDIRKVPFARRFVGLTDERAVQDRFYKNVEDISYASQEIKVAGEAVGLAATGQERRDAQENRKRIISQYGKTSALESALKLVQDSLKKLNIARKAVDASKRDDEWKEEKLEDIQQKKIELMNKFNRRLNKKKEDQREADEQARINPMMTGKERLAAMQQLNRAGLTATANLIKSLPIEPGSDFMDKLNA